VFFPPHILAGPNITFGGVFGKEFIMLKDTDQCSTGERIGVVGIDPLQVC